ncbi:MAG TPA: hypothetical protein DCZ72_15625 [Armatimonadetes bacterium]|nr:hypothetical protein [Armatimonadota bacterium]
MQVAYVSGPYWAPWWPSRALNIARAARSAWSLWRQGYATICPHTNSALLSLLWPPAERAARWLDGDLAFIDRLQPGDLVLMLRGWQHSPGARAEHQRAHDRPGVTIRYADGQPDYHVPVALVTPHDATVARLLAEAGATAPPADALAALDEAIAETITATGRLDPVVASVVRSTVLAAGTLLRYWRVATVEPAQPVLREVLASPDQTIEERQS